MSDPLSKREIEDVLSSIRRLVADERRDPARDLNQPLVLTPSLRVEPEPARALRASLEETIAELEAAVAASGRGAAHETPVAAVPPVVETEALARFEAELAAALGRPLPVLPADDGEAEPVPPPSNDLTARIAEAAARVRRRGVVPGPSEPEDDLSMEWAAAGEPVAEAPADPAVADWLDEPRPPRRLHLAGGLDWQPPPVPSAAGEAWRLPEGAARAAAEDDAPAEGAARDEAEDLVLDEAALRALVAQTLREELQGALGERITAAVRKLVRREIERALAGRSLD